MSINMNINWKLFSKIIFFIISFFLIIILYRKANYLAMNHIFSGIEWWQYALFLISLTTVILINSWRWTAIVAPYHPLKFSHAFQQVVATNGLDPILPMKSGSFLKAFYLHHNGINYSLSLGIVFFEKVADMSAVFICYLSFYLFSSLDHLFLKVIALISLFFLLFFLLFSQFAPHIATTFPRIQGLIKVWQQPTFYLLKIVMFSLLYWGIQSLQFVLFFYMVGLSSIPISDIIVGMLVVFFAGTLPLSFLGLGIREVLILYLFQKNLVYDQALILGLFSFLRLFLPTLLGLCFLPKLTSIFSKTLSEIISSRSSNRDSNHDSSHSDNPPSLGNGECHELSNTNPI